MKRSLLFYTAVVLLALIGIVRIVATCSTFNHTWDEPMHIATGLEWLDLGTYTYEAQHPPLVRIIIALGPFLSGVRISEDQREFLHNARREIRVRPLHWKKRYMNVGGEEGKRILYDSESYWRTLSLARMGVLPFFFLATIVVGVWSRKLFGNVAGLASVVLFTTLPPILAHAGLATLDMGVTALLLTFLFSLFLWLEQPSILRSTVLGCTLALSILSKITTFLFVPACLLALFLWRIMTSRKILYTPTPSIRKWIKAVCFFIITTFIVSWAGYRFSLSPLTSKENRPHKVIDKMIGSVGTLHDMVYKVVENPILPAPELIAGIYQARAHNNRGHKTFLLGETHKKGLWYFFPVALSVKTPLPFLILTIAGIIFLIPRAQRKKNWYTLEPAVCAVSLVIACIFFANINIGIRHVLLVYPLFAIIAGAGVVNLWNNYKFNRLCHISVVILMIWQLSVSFGAHPDYLAHFNEIAGRHPEKILVGSDLDWGQDLDRLSKKLKILGANSVYVAYSGYADLDKHGLPTFKLLLPYNKATGWVAVSISILKRNAGFSWLEAYEPVTKAGKSIWIYHITKEKS